MSLTDHQLSVRRSGVTATDMRALTGLDPYGRTPHDVFVSKVLGDGPFKESEAMSLGNELEPIVIRRLAQKIGRHPLRLDPNTLTRRHPDHPTHIATPDVFFAESAVHDPDSIGQVKVVGGHGWYEWGADGDALPDWVVVQCAWELHVTGMPVEHIGALCGTEVRTYAIQPDTDLEGSLVEAADKFWTDHVEPRKPPAVDGSEGSGRMVRRLFPRDTGPIIQANAEAEGLARQYFELSRDIKGRTGQLENVKQLLALACGPASGLTGDGWRLRLAWREPSEVKGFTRDGYRHFDLRPTKGH
jgi:predicted phage-related endonuclease